MLLPSDSFVADRARTCALFRAWVLETHSLDQLGHSDYKKNAEDTWLYTVLYQLSYRRNSPTGTRTQDPRLKRLTRIAVYPQCWCHLTSDPTTKPPTGLEPAILQLRAGCLNQIWPRRLGMYLYSAQQRCIPPTGLEPATLRLKVPCSTN